MTPCPSNDRLVRLLDPSFADPERSTIEQHLRACPSCSALLDRLGGPLETREGTTASMAAQRTSTETRWGSSDAAGQEQCETVDLRPPETALAPAFSPVGYEIIRELGHGGMGVVYQARQTALKRTVALKMILAGPHAGPEQVARFRAEAEAVAKLQHPHIVQIYEIDTCDGRPFFSLEYVEGGSLDRKLKDGPLSGREAAGLVETLARAMDHAHRRGILHRDLKPANVLLTADGTPKITDFGLAKQLDDPSGRTQSGAVMGTPSYMAPEQAEGKIKELGARTDVYALGAVLYELLTGRPPFRGDSAWETVRQVIHQDPVPPSKLQPRVHRDLETICLKALAKEPAERYESALALAEDLARFQAGDAILARREGLGRKVWRKVRRRPGVIAAAAGVCLALAVAGYFARVSVLQEEIRAALEAPELTEQYLVQVEERIAGLQSLAPARAEAAAARLYHVVADRIRDEWKGTLTPEKTETIRTAIRLLEDRDSELSGTLSKELATRLALWEPVFRLPEQAGELRTVFPAVSGVQVDGAGKLLRRTAAAGTPPLVQTSVPSQGKVLLQATFAYPSWQEAAELGLVLNAGTGRGYAFLLRVPANSNAVSLAVLRERGEVLSLAILRNGKLLRERVVKASELAAAALQIEARREGDQLTLEVSQPGRATPLTLRFHDVFPLGPDPGIFALHWPAGIGLQSLRGFRQNLPPAPSALERGDELYGQGRYDEALAWYRDQGISGGQEARYKESLCLVKLRRFEDAAVVLEALGTQPGERWPLLANLQLVLVHLRLNHPVEAHSALQQISLAAGPEPMAGLLAGQPKLVELASLIPAETLRELWDAMVKQNSGVNLFLQQRPRMLFDGTHARLMSQLADLIDHLDFRPEDRIAFLFVTAFTQRTAGWDGDARKTYEKILRADPAELRASGLELDVLHEVCGLHSLYGRGKTALELLDSYLVERPGVYRPDYLPLLITRAQVLAKLKRPAEAEKALNDLLRLVPAERLPYFKYAMANLVLGFVREQLGDGEGAVKAWRRGLYKNFPETGKRQPIRDPLGVVRLNNVVYGFILGSLADDLTPADAEELLSQLYPSVEKAVRLDVVQRELRYFLPGLRAMLHRPRSREYVRRLAYQDIPLREGMEAAPKVVAVAAARHTAFGGRTTDAQEEALWRLAGDGIATYVLGERDPARGGVELALMAAIFNDYTLAASTAWPVLSARLEPRLRGGLAYLFGHRYLHLGRRDQATRFFQTARDVAASEPAAALYGRLAEAELKRLGAR